MVCFPVKEITVKLSTILEKNEMPNQTMWKLMSASEIKLTMHAGKISFT